MFLPLIGDGQLWGTELRGNIQPLSVSVAAGAFLFGMGMQVGGGCASGTLFTVGGGSVRMVVTLVAFIVGSVLGALHRPLWEDTVPSAGPVSLQTWMGTPGALATTLVLLGAAWFIGLRQRRHGAGRPWLWLVAGFAGSALGTSD